MGKSLKTVENLAVPGVSIDSYVSKISAIDILSAEEEKRLALKWYEEEDVEAARQLVMSHLRFVVHIARSYSGYGLPQADIIQEGNVGLMKAVKRFNPHVGVRLISFAVHWIKAEIHEYVLRNWRIVKIATTKGQRKMFFNLRSAKKNLTWLSAEEAQSIANELGVDVGIVTEMEKRLSAKDAAFDANPEDLDGDEKKPSPSGYLVDKRHNPAADVEEENWQRIALDKLKKIIPQLDARSRDILLQRWFRDGKKMTLHELANKYQVSAERIRQIEKQAIEKIRSLL